MTSGVYRFEELLALSPSDPAPPLVFLHVPKTAGSTLNSILMRNYKVRADSRADKFLERWSPTEIKVLGGAPRSEDDRARPAFFTGHVDIGNAIFEHLPGRYVVVTLLREPVSRVVSHFRFNSTQPSAIQSAIQEQGLDVVQYLKRGIRQQYEIFAPAADSDRVETALQNLGACVSLFGLQEEFDQFLTLLAALIGLRDVSYRSLNRTPPNAPAISPEQESHLRELLQHDTAFYESASKLYRQRLQLMEKRGATRPHPWTPFYG
jgi:Sulfotransferase family